jgi:hypothetical protein
MTHPSTRREFLWSGGVGAASLAAVGLAKPPVGAAPPDALPPPRVAAGTPTWVNFPHLDPHVIAETVGKSHFDEARVRELVGRFPAVVNAGWDWGFGDWETPLGAAAHTGRRAIAEFLLGQGARIDIFAAAMLGYTDAVKGLIAAQPGIERTVGPHGISLLAHAKAGGEQAKDTLVYLETLPGAGAGLESRAISADVRSKYLGDYAFGAGESERFQIKLDSRGNLAFAYAAQSPRMLHSLGNDEFYPAGVFTTRFKFDLSSNPAALKISGGACSLAATRTGG